MGSARLWLAVVLLALAGCRAPQGLAPSTLEQLHQSEHGFLSGPVAGLRSAALLDNKDFSYSAALSPDSRLAAFTHLGPKNFQLGVWELSEEPRVVADVAINPYQFDVEAVDFTADARFLVTASRDGAVRVHSVKDGKLVASFLTEEPLVSVAAHPNGQLVAVGSQGGLLTMLALPELRFVSELRAHKDEVRALAFSQEGLLFSGGWDKSVAVFELAQQEQSQVEARVRYEKKGAFALVRGLLGRRQPAAFAFDSRSPLVVIKSELATRAGLMASKETVLLQTPMGQTLAPIAQGQSLAFKALVLEDLSVAICDACVPEGAQGVLGATFTERIDVAFDEATGEALLRPKKPAPALGPTFLLEPKRRLSFEYYVNDFTLDRSGGLLGVAFSEARAERSREVYEREKKGIKEPVSDANAGAIVDASTGRVLRKWSGHHGVVSTAAISPDGKTLATGGWDKQLRVWSTMDGQPIERQFGWSVRRVRFSRDGRLLIVAAWTPQNPLGDQKSDPSAVVYELAYSEVTVQKAQ